MALRTFDPRDFEDLLELGLHFSMNLLANSHFLALLLSVHTVISFLKLGHLGVLASYMPQKLIISIKTGFAALGSAFVGSYLKMPELVIVQVTCG